MGSRNVKLNICHPSPLSRGGQMYYMFGFLLLAFVVLVVVCAQTSIIICYFHLRSEDYRWWWRSFFSTGTRPISLPPLPPHSYWWVQAFLQSVSPSLSSFLLVGLISMVERNCNKRCPYYRGVLISGVSLERGVPLYTSFPPPPPPPPPGTTALYLFLFSLHYFVYKTTITGWLSYFVFFGYTFIMVFLFWILCGNNKFLPSVCIIKRCTFVPLNRMFADAHCLYIHSALCM